MIISDKKYACETCIKGHRSSSCKHFDRPLFEIKKKGRPITQCEHCRELRKTKQVHVKCICEGSKPPPSSDLHSGDPPNNSNNNNTLKKATRPGFGSAAFPNGLPHPLGAAASVGGAAVQPQLPQNDSERACACNSASSGGLCSCCVPKKTPSTAGQQRRARTNSALQLSSKSPTQQQQQQQQHGHGHAKSPSGDSGRVLARVAELRPVLPGPPPPLATSMQDFMDFHAPLSGGVGAGQGHDPSSGAYHAPNYARHPDNLYSPYSRAYGAYQHVNSGSATGHLSFHPDDRIHHNHHHHHHHHQHARNASMEMDLEMEMESITRNASSAAAQAAPQPNLNNGRTAADLVVGMPSQCTCGEGCQCQNCDSNGGRNGDPGAPPHSQPSCIHPDDCLFCMNCTMSVFEPLVQQLSTTTSNGNSEIDAWLRNLSSTSLPSSRGNGDEITNPVTSILGGSPGGCHNNNDSTTLVGGGWRSGDLAAFLVQDPALGDAPSDYSSIAFPGVDQQDSNGGNGGGGGGSNGVVGSGTVADLLDATFGLGPTTSTASSPPPPPPPVFRLSRSSSHGSSSVPYPSYDLDSASTAAFLQNTMRFDDGQQHLHQHHDHDPQQQSHHQQFQLQQQQHRSYQQQSPIEAQRPRSHSPSAFSQISGSGMDTIARFYRPSGTTTTTTIHAGNLPPSSHSPGPYNIGRGHQSQQQQQQQHLLFANVAGIRSAPQLNMHVGGGGLHAAAAAAGRYEYNNAYEYEYEYDEYAGGSNNSDSDGSPLGTTASRHSRSPGGT